MGRFKSVGLRLTPALIGVLVAIAPASAAAKARLGAVRGIGGRMIDLDAPAGGVSVLIFYSSECPISNSYSPTINRLTDTFPASRARFAGICVDPDLSDDELAAHARDFGLKIPVARDASGSLARRLGATKTPEAFVLDDQGKVRYHGRIDDQFLDRPLKRNAHPDTAELRDAVTALLAGKPPAVEFVEAVGCPLPEAPVDAKAPTYAKEVATILQTHCQECQRKGQVGPFSLENYEQAAKRAGDLAAVVEDHKMPPWKPSPGFGPKFKSDKSLTPEQIKTLVAWADAGAPAGNLAPLPAPPHFQDEWAHGTPDLVVEMPVDYKIPAEGEDIYRCFVLKTDLPKDMYIAGIEYRPGNRKVVHHIIGYVDASGQARKRDAEDAEAGYMCFSGPNVEIVGDLGGWAPGMEPSILPDGVGRSLPKGADVVMQVHYHPSGKPETDRSRIGLYFAKKPIQRTLHWGAAINTQFKLPPGASNVEVKAAWPIPVDAIAYGVTPHMHMIGRDMMMRLKFPDGRIQDLCKIDDWDFGWQNTYYFEQPIEVPKGTVLQVVAHFDNSASNPRNPNKPPKEVGWGEATTDEMCIGFLALAKKHQDLTKPGEKDDLLEIFMKQRAEGRKHREQQTKQKQDKPRDQAAR